MSQQKPQWVIKADRDVVEQLDELKGELGLSRARLVTRMLRVGLALWDPEAPKPCMFEQIEQVIASQQELPLVGAVSFDSREVSTPKRQ